MKFAKYSFTIAGIYGLVVMLPQYFLEEKNGIDYPPPITHPEYFYGFIGVVVAFQLIFLLIGRNPAKYRQMMLPSIVEKLSFAIAVAALYAQSRVAEAVVFFAGIDTVLAVLFVISYIKTRGAEN